MSSGSRGHGVIQDLLHKFDADRGRFDVQGGGNQTSVGQVAKIVVAAAGRADTRIVFGGGDRGWLGDVPRFRYDISQLQALGWQPKHDSTDAVRYAV